MIQSPCDSLVFQQVGDGGDVRRDAVGVVVVDAKVVAANGRDVVGLAGVCDGEVVGQCDALFGQPLEVWVAGGLVVVGVFEPDGNEAVEGAARDEAGGRACIAVGVVGEDGGGRGDKEEEGLHVERLVAVPASKAQLNLKTLGCEGFFKADGEDKGQYLYDCFSQICETPCLCKPTATPTTTPTT